MSYLRKLLHVYKLILIASLLFSATANAQSITGAITHIRDGDTFLIGNQPIRLCGIDAPERKTNAGKKATAFITKAIKGKAVSCIPVNQGTVCDWSRFSGGDYRIVGGCSR